MRLYLVGNFAGKGGIESRAVVHNAHRHLRLPLQFLCGEFHPGIDDRAHNSLLSFLLLIGFVGSVHCVPVQCPVRAQAMKNPSQV